MVGSTSLKYKLSRSPRLPCSLMSEGGEVCHHYSNNMYANYWNWTAEQIDVCRIWTPPVFSHQPAVSTALPFQKTVIGFRRAVSECATSSPSLNYCSVLPSSAWQRAYFVFNASGFQREWEKLVICSCFERTIPSDWLLVNRPFLVRRFGRK